MRTLERTETILKIVWFIKGAENYHCGESFQETEESDVEVTTSESWTLTEPEALVEVWRCRGRDGEGCPLIVVSESRNAEGTSRRQMTAGSSRVVSASINDKEGALRRQMTTGSNRTVSAYRNSKGAPKLQG